MKKIFKYSSLLILSLPLLAVKCGEEAIEPPDTVTTAFNITIEEALMDSTKYIDLLVEIDSVFFTDPAGTLFNGTTSNGSGSRDLTDCDGNKIVVFTSTDREFSYQPIPTGLGTIKGILSEYQGTRQILLRSIDDAADLTREPCPEKRTLVTVKQFNTGLYEGQTVYLENVQFKLDGEDAVFNGTDGNGAGSRTLTDCEGEELIVHTRGDSPLSYELIPEGNGTIVGTAGSFGSTKQLVLRSQEDYADMTQTRCVVGGPSNPECSEAPTTTYLTKDFNDGSVTSGGWEVVNASGSLAWGTEQINGNEFAKITNRPTFGAAESWLISPATDISSATNPLVSFINVKFAAGDNIKCKISTNYNGSGDPSSATWTDLTADLDADESDFESLTCSSNIDISAHKSANTYIAFVYTGTASTGAIWYLDDILIKE